MRRRKIKEGDHVMSVVELRGHLLDSKARSIANPVNCAGFLDSGPAARVGARCPGMLRDYRTACWSYLKPGRLHIWEHAESGETRYVVNVATKNHWREPARIEWVEQGFYALAAWIEHKEIESIALPRLKRGHSELAWDDFRRLVTKHLEPIPNLTVELWSVP